MASQERAQETAEHDLELARRKVGLRRDVELRGPRRRGEGPVRVSVRRSRRISGRVSERRFGHGAGLAGGSSRAMPPRTRQTPPSRVQVWATS